tara:strand:- start:7304 stop:7957 length:654 start_codon:yes stop_codon:yes gene_type:complete
MTRYKAIATITWQFESGQSYEQALRYAKEQLDLVLDSCPQGEEFAGYSAHMNIVRLKDKKKLVKIAEFGLEEVLPFISKSDDKKEYSVGEKTYNVRMNSDRYFVFLKNIRCVSCGLEGQKMILELNPGDDVPHFNLYGEEHGRLVLMTKDHILARSKGGEDILENYQTMCCVCNNLKGNYDLNLDQVLELRQLYANNDKAPRKELRDLINNRREGMV